MGDYGRQDRQGAHLLEIGSFYEANFAQMPFVEIRCCVVI
jgi:hypothetical protein